MRFWARSCSPTYSRSGSTKTEIDFEPGLVGRRASGVQMRCSTSGRAWCSPARSASDRRRGASCQTLRSARREARPPRDQQVAGQESRLEGTPRPRSGGTRLGRTHVHGIRSRSGACRSMSCVQEWRSRARHRPEEEPRLRQDCFGVFDMFDRLEADHEIKLGLAQRDPPDVSDHVLQVVSLILARRVRRGGGSISTPTAEAASCERSADPQPLPLARSTTRFPAAIVWASW